MMYIYAFLFVLLFYTYALNHDSSVAPEIVPIAFTSEYGCPLEQCAIAIPTNSLPLAMKSIYVPNNDNK